MREWPVPKACTSPPPALASKQIRLACSSASSCVVAIRWRSSRAAAMKVLLSLACTPISLSPVPDHRVTMLGTGLIGLFYTVTLHGQRNRDSVHVVYSRSRERADAFAAEHGIPHALTDLEGAIAHPDTDTVVVGLPNDLHEEAVSLAARHGKAILCTKPLARNVQEAKRMLDTVEAAGVFGGY